MFTERFQQLQNGAARATIQLDTSKCAIGGGGNVFIFNALCNKLKGVFHLQIYKIITKCTIFFYSLLKVSVSD